MKRQRRTNCFEGAEEEREREREGGERERDGKSVEGSLEVTFRRGELRARQGNPLDHSLGTLRNPGSPHTHIHVREVQHMACPHTPDLME